MGFIFKIGLVGWLIAQIISLNVSYKDSTRTTRMSDIVTACGAASHLIVYTGSAPSKTAAPTGTVLCTFALANPIGTATTGVLTFSAISSVTAGNSGTPGYFRVIDGGTDDGTHTQIQGSCGVGSGELNFSSTISSGGAVSVSSATITEGNN